MVFINVVFLAKEGNIIINKLTIKPTQILTKFILVFIWFEIWFLIPLTEKAKDFKYQNQYDKKKKINVTF